MAVNHFALPCQISPPLQGRPRLAGVANHTPLARQRIATFSLPLTNAWHRLPSRGLTVSVSLRPAICGLSSCRRGASSSVSFNIVPMYLSPLSVVLSRHTVFRLMQRRPQEALPSQASAQPQPYRMIGGRCLDLPPLPCLSKTRIHLTTPRLSKMRIHLVACRNISAENSAPTPQRCPIERAKL
jgi:hypothetical protein